MLDVPQGDLAVFGASDQHRALPVNVHTRHTLVVVKLTLGTEVYTFLIGKLQ